MHTKDSRPKKILRYVALGSGVAVLSLLAPQLPYNLLKTYLRHKKFGRSLFLRDLKRLQEKKLITCRELKDGSVKVILEKKGKERILRYTFDELALVKQKKWDGKWRLVMFDIPTAKNKARDALRRKMTELGFYQLQKSAFIHPYPCEDEINFIASLFEVYDHILLLYVSNFEGEKKLMRHFSLF